MLLFTSEKFPDVPRVMVFTLREGGRPPNSCGGGGQRIKGREVNKKQNVKYSQGKEGFFLDRKRQKEMQGGGRKEEMSKWLSGFFIISSRNSLISNGSSAQRFLQGKNELVSRLFTNCCHEIFTFIVTKEFIDQNQVILPPSQYIMMTGKAEQHAPLEKQCYSIINKLKFQ